MRKSYAVFLLQTKIVMQAKQNLLIILECTDQCTFHQYETSECASGYGVDHIEYDSRSPTEWMDGECYNA